MLSRLRSQQKGDTIVEVLIVLAVLGLALGISYATASRSLTAARQAQENAKATELLRAQLESVRVLAANGESSNPELNVFVDGPYCIDNSNKVQPANNGSVPNPACQFHDGLYQVRISENDNTFTLSAQWEDVAGQGMNESKLAYRWYKP